MKKNTAKYLLSICILLMSISTQSVANTNRKSTFNSYKDLKNASIDSHLQELGIYIRAASVQNGERVFFNEVYEEEYFFAQNKKNSVNTILSSALFYTCLHRIYLLKNPQVLFLSKHPAFLSYNSIFILFGVFRI
jgi:hypothetical protein